MPDDYSAFINLNSRPPLDDSRGYIVNEDDVPVAVDGFQWRKRLLRFVPSDLTSAISQILTGIVRVKVLADDQFNAVVLFEQTLTFRLLVVQDGFGGVTFIPLDNGGKIETTVVNGSPIDPATAWCYVDTPTPTPFSEFATPIFRPNSGGVIGGINIDIDIEMPLYNVDFPAGAVFFVDADEWRTGAAIPIDWFQVAVKTAPGFASLFDRYNALIFAVPISGGVEIQRRVTQPGILGTLERRAFLPGLSNPAILKGTDNALHLLANEATVGRLRVSEDDGVTWQRVSNRSATGVEVLAVAFGTGYKNFEMAHLPNGTVGMKAERDGSIYYSNTADTARVELVGKSKRNGSYKIAAGTDGAVLISNLDHQFELDGSGPPIETGGGA